MSPERESFALKQELYSDILSKLEAAYAPETYNTLLADVRGLTKMFADLCTSNAGTMFAKTHFLKVLGDLNALVDLSTSQQWEESKLIRILQLYKDNIARWLESQKDIQFRSGFSYTHVGPGIGQKTEKKSALSEAIAQYESIEALSSDERTILQGLQLWITKHQIDLQKMNETALIQRIKQDLANTPINDIADEKLQDLLTRLRAATSSSEQTA